MLKMGTKRTLIAFALTGLMSACGSLQPHQLVQPETPAPAPPPEVNRVDDRTFDTETLYALLVAEVAIDRKRYDIALNNYTTQAHQTHDLGVIERASHISRMLNSHRQTLDLAELWRELEPHNEDAARLLLSELVVSRRLLEATAIASELAAEGYDGVFVSIASSAAEGDKHTIQVLKNEFEQLYQQYPNRPNLALGYSILLQTEREFEQALAIVRKLARLQSDNLRIAYQQVILLEQMGREKEARSALANLVEAHPHSKPLRTRYARMLWQIDPQAAREQVKALYEMDPSDAKVIYFYALLEKEAHNLHRATSLFQKLLNTGDLTDEANFYLGRIYRAQNQINMALLHYQSVNNGDTALLASVETAEVLVAKGRSQEALDWLEERKHALPVEHLPMLTILQSDIQTSEGKMLKAEEILSEGLRTQPDNARLLYARALLYSRLEMIDEAEHDFLKILQQNPNHSASLNALGYTLADQTDRFEEAYSLIKRALELKPNDPAILDSMGWVHYRMGNLEAALVKLRKASSLSQDHEIAAHLGEVLWVSGAQKEALSVWRNAIQRSPKSQVLQNTLQRFNIDQEKLVDYQAKTH